MKNLSSVTVQPQQVNVSAENPAKIDVRAEANNLASSKSFQSTLQEQIQQRKNQSKTANSQQRPEADKTSSRVNNNQLANKEGANAAERLLANASAKGKSKTTESQADPLPDQVSEQRATIALDSQTVSGPNITTDNASLIAAMMSAVEQMPKNKSFSETDAKAIQTDIDVLNTAPAKGGVQLNQGLDAALNSAMLPTQTSQALRNSNNAAELTPPAVLPSLVEQRHTGHTSRVDAVLPDTNKPSAGLSSTSSFAHEMSDLMVKDKPAAETQLPANYQLPLPNNPAITMQQAASANTITPYFGRAGWDQAISQKVVWMVGAGEQSATLTLNPPDLGPLQVVIHVHNDQADTTFISDNPEVRQALEDGISNLRNKMSEAGVQLGQTNVSNSGQSQSSFQQQAQNRNRSVGNRGVADANADLENPRAQLITRISNGLVDTFA